MVLCFGKIQPHKVSGGNQRIWPTSENTNSNSLSLRHACYIEFLHHSINMVMSGHGNDLHIIGLLSGESISSVTGGFPSQKASNVKFMFSLLTDYTVEQTIGLPVIQDAMMFIWHHYNALILPCSAYNTMHTIYDIHSFVEIFHFVLAVLYKLTQNSIIFFIWM